MFDGEVTDAAIGVDGPIRADASGWACLQASLTRAAIIPCEWGVRLKDNIQHELGEQEIGASHWRDQATVPADPAQARQAADLAFEKRSAVGESLRLHRATDFHFDPFPHGTHLFNKKRMIIASLNVTRYTRETCLCGEWVRPTQGEDRPRRGHQGRRIFARFHVTGRFKVPHTGVIATFDPVFEDFKMGEWPGNGDAA